MVRKVLNFLGLNVVIASGKLLGKADRRKIYSVATLQISLSVLDLFGVAIIGVLGAISISGIQSQRPGSRIAGLLDSFHLGNSTVQTQVLILGILATAILVSRTILSILITRRYIFFLSRKGSEITLALLGKILSAPMLKVQEVPTQKTIFALTESVKALTLGVLATSVSLFSDLALMGILAVGLFVVDSVIAFSTVVLFGAVGLILHKSMTTKSQVFGRAISADSVALNEEFSEVLHSYRESLIFGTRLSYYNRIANLRNRLAVNQAEIQFMPNISKYVIELSLIIGALTISAIQFSMKDAVHAVATLSVFMAAGSRIGPAVLRVQQGVIQIRSSIGVAEPGLELIESFQDVVTDFDKLGGESRKGKNSNFVSSIIVDNLSFRYPNSQKDVLCSINFEVPRGTFLAIAGSSGAGKTTLADLILGVIPASSGKIEISGLKPLDAIIEWPGKISYVPQEVYISNSSIRKNVALGIDESEIDDSRVRRSLTNAQLIGFIDDSTQGLNIEVGENGSKLSGGQKQRVGIARALYSDPELLVLDEATSSLDGETEAEITSTLLGLKGKITLVVIAHRLSTIKEADHVIYLHDGKILAQGTFAQVSEEVEAFGIN
jgi:ABC-type multidrug transport system fused ATPase/permease subunit